MKISKVKLKNFRCFGEEETVINLANITAFIGTNSSGKTAVLQALLKVFGSSTKDRELERADFHIPKGKSPDEISENKLSIEVIVEFQELQVEDQTIQNCGIPVFFERMVVNDTGKIPYVRFKLESSWSQGNTPEGNIETKLWYILVPEGSSSEEEQKEENRIEVKNYERSSIQVIYVPAVRDPSTQLKSATGTILWRIMHKIKWPENINIELSQRTKMIDQLLESQPGVESIKKIIGEEWKKYHRDIRYTEANIKFSSDELEDILKKIEVEFLPSVTTKGYKIDSLGDGLRSLFYLSLVGSLLRIDKEANDDTEGAVFCNGSNVALTILEVEEPENHVSPHLMGKIIDNLSSIAQIGNAQIILTSHTPAIVKRVDPEAIRYLRINNDTYCSILNEIKLPPQKGEAYKYIKEAIWAYPEIYFARLVILGEGDSEEIVIPKVIQLLDTGLDASGISVVPLGGRHVNHFWKLLDSLDIPYVTLLDLDTERNGGAWGRIKYAITQLIKNGSNKDKLLRLENGNVLSDDSLNKMHKREINKVEINTWIKRLEEYDVFFSAPLDIDFMMLESFLDEYKMAIPKNGGPHIPNKITELDMYNEKLNKAVKATLKENGGNGETYTPEQKELMIWYNYFFLGRGKPSTHIIATSNIDKEKLQRNMPAPLKNLLAAVKRKLQDDPFSDISRG